MKKFEYKEVKDCYGRDLQSFGKDGWELCAIYVSGMSYIWVFKREIIEEKHAPFPP